MDDEHWAVRLPTGYRIGPWRVSHGLASGSWSSVYAAERDAGPDDSSPDDSSPDDSSSAPQQVALKIVPTGTLTARQLSHLADMTDRELTAHRRLAHPRLIGVLGTYVIDDPAEPGLDGATVLALELADCSLSDKLTAAQGAGLPEAPWLIAEICAGLAHLHDAGWVHGDLKPSNVLLMADGSVRLADFGLAAEMNGTHAYLPPAGTADYMPPERWAEGLRADGTAVRQTADIWALGVTACQLLTGRLPFPGVTSRSRAAAAAAYAEGRAELALPAGLSGPWRQFLTDSLAPDHATRRSHTAASLRRQAEAAGGARPPARSTRRARTVRGAIAAALAIAATVGGSMWAEAAPWDTGGRDTTTGPAEPKADYAPYFRTDADIPAKYYDLIVQAGTKCVDDKAVTPLLIAAMLKTESNFDPNLSDPENDEYGIARWTPRVLQYYLPPGRRGVVPTPPFPPETSIPAMGSYLCRFAPTLESVPGDPRVNVAAAYRTSSEMVRQAGGVPDRRPVQEYVQRLRVNLDRYRPVAGSTPAPSGR